MTNTDKKLTAFQNERYKAFVFLKNSVALRSERVFFTCALTDVAATSEQCDAGARLPRSLAPPLETWPRSNEIRGFEKNAPSNDRRRLPHHHDKGVAGFVIA